LPVVWAVTSLSTPPIQAGPDLSWRYR